MIYKKTLFLTNVLVFLFAANGCAKYAIKNEEISKIYKNSSIFPLHFNQTRSAIKTLLSARGQKFKEHIQRNRFSTDIEMEWVRDSSLAYFYIQRGQRKPHLVHWKGVWKIHKVTNFRSQVELEIMEIAFIGPREQAPDAPRIDGQWAESTDGNLRAALELRRLWNASLPQKSLPNSLGQIQVPSLNFPPLASKEHREAKVHHAPRPTAF